MPWLEFMSMLILDLIEIYSIVFECLNKNKKI